MDESEADEGESEAEGDPSPVYRPPFWSGEEGESPVYHPPSWSGEEGELEADSSEA